MSGLYLPGETAPAAPASWPKANAWIYSWPRSDHPGYRTIRVGGTWCQVASTTGTRWDQYVAALSTALGAAGWTATLGTDGRVTLAGSSAVLSYPDRLGWLLGMGTEAGYTEGAAVASRVSRFVPPGGIPLLGATWDQVDVERERELVTDRQQRQSGYVFGGARVWRWRLTLTRWALDALLSRWCLRGKVTLYATSASAIASGTPDGYLTGYVMGLDGPPAQTGPTADYYRVTLLVAGSTS